jgi:DNA (cytosine-5)-methyltransferase 1
MKTKKVLDLFSGAGGFSLGFQQAGCKISAALEIDKWAAETFQFNHPSAKVFNFDISTLSEKEIEKNFGQFNADIIIGGPPCQGYSIANRAGIDSKDPRNSLFEFFVRFGKVLKPKIFLKERIYRNH